MDIWQEHNLNMVEIPIYLQDAERCTLKPTIELKSIKLPFGFLIL